MMRSFCKRGVSWLMSVLLMLSLLPASVYAADVTEPGKPEFTATPALAVYDEEEEDYTIDKTGAEIKTGDIVAYKITVANNPGMIGFKIFLDYDKTQLELRDMTAARKFSGGVWLPVKDIGNMGVISWVTTGDVDANGTVVTLYFDVLAAAGTTVDFPMRMASCMNESKEELGGTLSYTSFTVAGGGETPTVVPVTGVTLDKTTLELVEGGDAQLTAAVAPDNATNSKVTWTSDSAQVTVDETGKVTAKYFAAGDTGKAAITVTTEDGSYTASCQVTVTHKDLQKVDEQPASCTEAGQKAHYFCNTCGRYYLVGDGDTVGAETTPDELTIPAALHTLTPVAEKAATCTENGHNAYWTCSACGKAFKDANGSQPTTVEAETLDALGHDYTVSGHDDTDHWKACSRCNEKDASSVAAHTLVVVKKTYADGSTTHQVQCSACAYNTERDHDADDGDVKNEWKHDGENHWQEYGCGTIMNKSAHNWDGGVVTTQPTCTQEGEKTYTCGTCGETKTETVAKAPHTLQKTDAKAATCAAKGNNDYWTCSVCKGVFQDEQGKVKTTVAAETLPIDPNHHTGSTVQRDAVAATCNMSGHEADTYCKDCGALLARGAAIPATGRHTYGADGRCTTCGNTDPAAGVDTGKLKPADTVNGRPVSPDNSGRVIAGDDGKTVIRTPAAADDNTVQQVKDALTGGSIALYVDNGTIETLTGNDGGAAELAALASGASGERRQELEKLAAALRSLLNDSGRKNVAGQTVYDSEMQLRDVEGVLVAELMQAPGSIRVALPITETQYQALQGKQVCVLRGSTDASGAAAVTELDATVGGSQGARVLQFTTDRGGTLVLASYETVSSGNSGGGSSDPSTAPRTADPGVTGWCVLLGVSALLGTALVARKRRQA